MLIGVFIALLFSSAGDLPGHGFIHTINAFVKENIAEADRKKAISSDVDEIENALETFSDELKRAGKQMVKLNSDHGSGREAFEGVLNGLNQQRMDAQNKILDLRFKIRERMTRQEWQAAFGKQ